MCGVSGGLEPSLSAESGKHQALQRHARNRRYGILAEVHARALMDRVDQHVDDLAQCAGLAIGIGGEWHGDVISTAGDPRNALAARGEDPSFLLATPRSVVCGI